MHKSFAESPCPVYPVVKLGYADQLNRLLELPVKDRFNLEIDISYLDIEIVGSNGERHYYPQLMTVINRYGSIVAYEIAKSINDRISHVFNMMLNHFKFNQARPSLILTCREDVNQLLKPLCEQLDIRLKLQPTLQVTPYAVEKLTVGLNEEDDLERWATHHD